MAVGKKGPESDPGARQPAEYLAVGRILRPHGIRGELLLEAAPDLVGMLSVGGKIYLGPDRTPATILSLRTHAENYLLLVKGTVDRSSADRYRGTVVYVRSQSAPPLPPHVFYHWQIVGLEVQTEAGEILGKIAEILQTGANDVYVVRDEAGAEVLLPAIEPVILKVDLDGKRMLVRLIPGLRPEP
jgi:16S rRNA processing protein RimM